MLIFVVRKSYKLPLLQSIVNHNEIQVYSVIFCQLLLPVWIKCTDQVPKQLFQLFGFSLRTNNLFVAIKTRVHHCSLEENRLGVGYLKDLYQYYVV